MEDVMTTADSFDVLVVGSGGGALAGAYLAAKAGLTTAVVERTTQVGGTSAYSGGACWLPGSDVQQRAGLPDSTESARTYLNNLIDSPDQQKIEAFLAQAPRLVAAFESDPALEFEWIPFPEYFDAPGRVSLGRSIQPVDLHRDALPTEVATLIRPPVERDRVGGAGRHKLSGGQALIARLLNAFIREGGTVLTGHHVIALHQEHGSVTGVEAVAAGQPFRISATHGVLIAAGGFEGSAQLRAEHGVPGDARWTMAPAGTNTGEPIFAAAEMGAATDLLDQGWFCPGLAQPDGGGSFTLGFRGGIMVDSNGRRYADEGLPYDQFGRTMAAKPERIPSWFIFDSREGGGLPAIAMPEGSAQEHLEAGTRVWANSIAELARSIGVPEDALIATVERFNGFASAGVDEDFHRGEDEYDAFFSGSGDGAALTLIDQPPYYAARFVLSDLGTKGGLVTDASGRVLREDGKPIEGLYAAGNSAASITGTVYPAPGIPLGTAMVFASLAVADMASSALA